MKLFGLILLAAFSLNAHADKKSKPPCDAQDVILTAAEEAIPGTPDRVTSDPADFEKTAGGHDEWYVNVNYNDNCHRTMTVYMKAGTCNVSKKVKVGEETCTDD